MRLQADCALFALVVALLLAASWWTGTHPVRLLGAGVMAVALMLGVVP